ncbi:TcaA NTF2-like domain-containing protein [Clostridium ganghwense]|uniref:TcaA protein NTF2-like domain-containing protein n=1 Tax=Clostridium ganghwense TaxID=312089 RepID=A0ABT4CPQ3_9CLOT|nr:hypothetical protein [Clostridium ganghwense]MCY6371025.1 hypothetical protein [Clostridium ganghwense]
MLSRILKHIPGFRTGKRWKMFIAVIGYIIMISGIFTPTGVTVGDRILGIIEYLILFIIPFLLITNVANIRNKLPLFKKRKVLYNILGYCVTVILLSSAIGGLSKFESPQYKELQKQQAMKEKAVKEAERERLNNMKSLDEATVKKLIKDYEKANVKAVNGKDFKKVEKYILTESNFYNSKKENIEKKSQNIKKINLLGYELAEIKELNKNEYSAKVNEKINIYYTDGKEETREYNNIYTVKGINEKVGISDLSKSQLVKSEIKVSKFSEMKDAVSKDIVQIKEKGEEMAAAQIAALNERDKKIEEGKIEVPTQSEENASNNKGSILSKFTSIFNKKKDKQEKDKESKVIWNKLSVDADVNLNTPIAIRKLQKISPDYIFDHSQNIMVKEVHKSPTKYIGTDLRISGTVINIEELSASNPYSILNGQKNVGRIYILSDEGYLIDLFMTGDFTHINKDDYIEVCGYFTGYSSVTQIFYGERRGLTVVGNVAY